VYDICIADRKGISDNNYLKMIDVHASILFDLISIRKENIPVSMGTFLDSCSILSDIWFSQGSM
jgi:hypothetical protein